MKVSCACCPTPVFEVVDGHIVVITRHHGVKHVSRIPLKELSRIPLPGILTGARV